MSELQYIEVAKIHPHPGNPRKDLGDLTELADSIKANGILQNLTVVPLVMVDPDATVKLGNDHYTVVIGHRRLAAAAIAGLDKVPCVVADLDDRQQARTMLMENMQRSDLTVYEQAQGFQMMLDLGDTVEEIAQRSGFSTSTVRRRLKMMELDQNTLKEVSGRQLSITDFDKLSEIEDIEERNRCLEKIGTGDFAREVSWVIRRQDEKKNRPLADKFFKDIKAKEIPSTEAWGPKYQRVCDIYLYEWDPEKVKLPEDKSEQLYVHKSDSYYTLYIKRQKAPPVKKSPEELARDKVLREAHKAMKEMAIKAYTSRSAFVNDLTVTKDNERAVLFGAVLAMGLVVTYGGPNREKVSEILGVSTDYYRGKDLEVVDAIVKIERSKMPRLIYAMFCDSEDAGNFSHYKSEYPNYEPSDKLRALYAWLVPLGYELSDEEKMLQDGTHPLYKDPDKKEAK